MENVPAAVPSLRHNSMLVESEPSLNRYRPPFVATAAGLFVPPGTFVTATVPAGVPSLDQSEVPEPSSATNIARPPKLASDRTKDDAPLSATRLASIRAPEPSAAHSSRPCTASVPPKTTPAAVRPTWLDCV